MGKTAVALVTLGFLAHPLARAGAAESRGYAALVALFADWRQAQKPRVVSGVPDYGPASLGELGQRLVAMRRRLAAIDAASLSPSERIDRRLVEAEMNGLDFDLRVLRPWARDPAFYATAIAEQSDTPAREGPTIEGAIELWRLSLPLAAADAEALRQKLRAIPALLGQARENLTADTRDLWLVGIRAHREQAETLAAFAERLRPHHPRLVPDVERAREAELAFTAWLEAGLPAKHGRSGVGRESYDWYLKNVHLVPYTWQDELRLMQRELDRALAHLALEEQRNRALPPLEPARSEAEWRRRSEAALADYMGFLRGQQVMSVRDYYEPALRARLGSFVPPEKRDFFSEVDAREPLLLRCHGYHWFDLARMQREPHASPIRRGPLLYNIWDSRAEGFATAMEELMMGAGLYAGRPRSRELVYVMIAQRAARAIASLRLHSNEWTIEEAVRFACDQTPFGWLRPEGETVWFEQRLYLEQPGYGTSYLTGKAMIESLLAERARALGKGFTLARFIDELNAAGLVPVSLIRDEMAGN
jgi:Bacterial protein of unknown function (DUF885)